MNNSIKINIMKNLFKVFACSIALFSMSAMTGCDNGDVYIYESSDLVGQRPTISIDTPSVSIAKFGKDMDVAVTADSYWTVESDQNWVVVLPSSGTGNASVKVAIAENETNSMRRATVTFTVYQKSTGWKWDKAELAVTQSSSDEPYVQGEIEKLVEFIKTEHSGVSSSNGTATLAYTDDAVEAVVLANYGDGNIGQILAVGDNTGYPNSAILLYDSAFGSSAVSNYPVGSVVKVAGLKNATYNNYYGLRELKSITVSKTGATQDLVVPELTVAEVLSNEYQGQYVAVKDVHATADWNGKPWIATDNQTVVLEDASGATLSVRMGRATYAPKFADYTINSSKIGTIKVLAEFYSSAVQVMPVYVSDVLELSNVALLLSSTDVILEATAGSEATITVQSMGEWTLTTDGAGFTVDPQSGDGNKNVVTIKAAADATQDLSQILGTITVTGGGETQTVTVRQKGLGGGVSILGLNDYIVTNPVKDGGSLSGYGPIKAYVAANNTGGNFYNTLAVVDNTGKPNSGMLFYGVNYTDAELPVGAEVEIDLSAANYVPYNGLPEVSGAKITATGNTAEMNVPELTVSEACSMNYVGQYICVKDVAPAAEGYWNATSENYANTIFTNTSGASVTIRVNKSAEFAADKYIVERGNIYGVMEIYGSSYQMFPMSKADVAAFAEPTDPLLKLDTDNLTFVAGGETKQVVLTVKNVPSYEIIADTTNNDQFETVVSADNNTVSVIARPNETDSAIDAVLTITVKYPEGELTQIVALKQNASVSADAERVTFSLASIEASVGGEIAKAYIGTVADPSTWLHWTTDGIGFAGVRIQRPAANSNYQGTIQMQGSTTNEASQGFITNTESLTDIQQIIVVLRANSATALNVSIFMGDKPADAADYEGTEVTPTSNTNVQDEATGQYVHTVSYEFAGNKYPYFKLVNQTRAAFYAESITVVYKK